MRVIFFGTPEFAVASFKKLVSSGIEIIAAVTAPDKARGRGLTLQPTEVKSFALSCGIPILQPDSLRDVTFSEQLTLLKPDLFVVVAFKILPQSLLSIPRIGAFNVHGSLLPKYRGAAPIQWALIEGEKETGVTTFLLEEKVDTGNILLQRRLAIDPEDTLGTLYPRMMELGAELCFETVKLIQQGNYTPGKQNDAEATKAPKITKEIAELQFTFSAEYLHNLIRGVTPVPGAYFFFKEKQFKVSRSKVFSERQLPSGTFFVEDGKLLVGTSTTCLQILEIQAEGRKRMEIGDFLRGNTIFNQ